MSFKLLASDEVEAIHDRVLNPSELPGRTLDKSLEGTLARVENRLIYGLIGDAFDLAAAYAVTLAGAHCFNDANKRTAYRTMLVCLYLNGNHIDHDTEEIGALIVRVAQGLVGEDDLAAYLRART